MEIKQGDTVRVSEKTPIEYNPHGEYAPLCVINSVVRCVVNDYAMCEPIWDDGAIQTPFLIPTKYLVKVDAEAKEPKFKIGDKVSINESSLKHGLRGEILTVEDVDKSDRTYLVQSRCMLLPIWLREDEVSLYTEPTEQTEAEKKPNIGSIKIPVEADLTDSYWDAYAADLAKELALKVANKYNDPKEAAEYAVSVAKAVVEGMKRK